MGCQQKKNKDQVLSYCQEQESDKSSCVESWALACTVVERVRWMQDCRKYKLLNMNRSYSRTRKQFVNPIDNNSEQGGRSIAGGFDTRKITSQPIILYSTRPNVWPSWTRFSTACLGSASPCQTAWSTALDAISCPLLPVA